MKDYLEKRREELKKRDGGFTLMEMLIVVAIIAVLIAIAIPVFTSQLERSREASDAANIRSRYAEVMVSILDDSTTDVSEVVELQQAVSGWQDESIPEALGRLADEGDEDGNYTVTVDVDSVEAGGTVTISYTAESGAIDILAE